MTNWIGTETFFLEPKEKMENLLKELFSNNNEFSPYDICPIPDTEKSEDEIWNWKAKNWGFTKYTFQSYFIYDNFSIIDFETNGFAGLLFKEFAKKNNLKYISYQFDYNHNNENLCFFENEETNFNFSFNFSSLIFFQKEFNLLNLIDISKLGLNYKLKDIVAQHREKKYLLFSNDEKNKSNATIETSKVKRTFLETNSEDDGWS